MIPLLFIFLLFFLVIYFFLYFSSHELLTSMRKGPAAVPTRRECIPLGGGHSGVDRRLQRCPRRQIPSTDRPGSVRQEIRLETGGYPLEPRRVQGT